MNEPLLIRFDTRRDCETQWRAVMARATRRLDMFDPDFAVFPLGASEVDAQLRTFLMGGGSLRLACHDPAHIERNAPRFLRLLRDYSHLVECRQTPRALRQLTDSFCIADNLHVLRRFHSDWMRGEAAFDAPEAVDVPAHRFAALWEESRPALAASVTGL
ncbi:hypothetical protein QPK31_02895 [Massilia sp. YIM B02769]|jgi:uncharacterized protein YjiS (DUF1127 family)|uniref:DUF7931 domain-containing protein n=1 Tax=unclassified Massilia TaxID=2609279 RepID=UPI0025B697AA|nr:MULTISPECIES: hypothetical protein [unclassified Massilia]MDN4057165.1 hypothetical protein [Massilia sp. YIM B02769]